MATEIGDSLEHLSWHEAGHALMAHWLGYDLRQCEIWLNRASPEKANHQAKFIANGNQRSDRDELLRVMGGPVAEAMSRGEQYKCKLVEIRSPSDAHEIKTLIKALTPRQSRLQRGSYQLKLQQDAVRVLDGSRSVIDDISQRLLKELEPSGNSTLSGQDLHDIVMSHRFPRRETPT